VAFFREKTCNGIICIFATLYVDPCSFISAHDVVLRMYLHCLLSFLFLFPRPHENLLGVQRVSNPSTGNQCISTPAHAWVVQFESTLLSSSWYKSDKRVYTESKTAIHLFRVYKRHVRWEGTSQRHKSTCYTVMLLSSTKNSPLAAGWNRQLLANWIGKKTFQKVRLTWKRLK